MALTPTQEVLTELLNTGTPKSVARFLADPKNAPKMQKFFSLYDQHLDEKDRLNYAALIGVFENGSQRHIEMARDYIGQCIDCNQKKIPKRSVRMPAALSRKIAGKEGDIALAKLSKTTGFALRNFYSINPGRWAMATAALVFKGIPELNAVVLAKGFKLRQVPRQLVTASAVVPVVAASAFNMMVASTDANAALRSTDHTIQTGAGKTHRMPTVGSQIAYDQDSLSNLINGAVKDALTFETDPVETQSGHYLSPYLLKKIRDGDASALKYTKLCFEAAKSKGIDPVLFTNQIFRESAHFNSDVISGTRVSAKGAISIAQFVPSTAKLYGLTLDDLKTNPRKALFAAAQMMKEKTAQFGGDQLLALAAYNGGDKAVTWVQKELGRTNITHKDWLAFMDKRRQTHPTKKTHAYQNETYAYIGDIGNIHWDDKYIAWAKKLHYGALPAGSEFIAKAVPAAGDNQTNHQLSQRDAPDRRIQGDKPRLENG